ncbi:MAG: DUF4126 domain-containing protein [Acidobacteriota bacterium]
MDLTQLSLALGASLAAGLNLYLTVLTLGLLQRFEVLSLPADLQVLAHPGVLIAAGILVVVEFLADKVPYVDNLWDAVHTFIRVPAGALLAAGALADLPPEWLWIAALAGGFVSFSTHGAKSSLRLAVNSSPEPFSNVALSLLEDGISFGLLWLVTYYPYVALGIGTVLLAASLATLYLLFRFFRLVLRRLRRVVSPKPATR